MKSDTVTRFITLMLILQVVTVAVLWVLNVLSENTTAAFELVLAANLVAFGVVLEAYRNPDAIRGREKPSPPPQAAPTAAPPPVEAPASHAAAAEPSAPAAPETQMAAALSKRIHIAIPIASIIILFVFALLLFQPGNGNAIPPTSTEIYIPAYLIVVVTLVFGSMYLFKRLLDTGPVDLH